MQENARILLLKSGSSAANSVVTLEVSRPFLAYVGENHQGIETFPESARCGRRKVTTQVNHEKH